MTVIFVDMDYFFVACEELRNPALKGKPVAVGTAPVNKKERGVIESGNYAARALGVHAAMSIIDALKLAPDLVYLQDDDAYYEHISEKVMQLLRSYGFKTEVSSIDEAALDLNGMDYTEALEVGKGIKNRINDELGLPCTVGISTGKVFAKMACDAAKPNGLLLLEQKQLKQFLSDKSVTKLPGVGHKTEERLNKKNISTIAELAKADPMVIIDLLGSMGKELYGLANGIDNSKVVESYEQLSIGRERTIRANTTDVAKIDAELGEIAKSVAKLASEKNLWFKTITLKVRYYDFTDRLKSTTLSHYTGSEEELHSAALTMLKSVIKDKPVRKIGIRISTLIDAKRQKRL